jgi:hypothetical protein
VDLFRRWRLDGRHEQKVRKTHTEIVFRVESCGEISISSSVNVAGAKSKGERRGRDAAREMLAGKSLDNRRALIGRQRSPVYLATG